MRRPAKGSDQIGGTMNAQRISIPPAALMLFCTFAVRAPAAEEPLLTAQDKNYLDGLMRTFLFDPKRSERVRVNMVVRTVWARSRKATVDGWFVAGKDLKRGRVYFTDGAS